MSIKSGKKSKVWVVYILRCSDKSLYTGITNNIEKRLAAHNQGRGAKYTRSRWPVKLLVTSANMDRITAMRLELKIKKLPKEKKLTALKKNNPRNKKSENIICQECPNGCNLILKWKDASNVFISGNKCSSGISYAACLIHRNKKAHIHASEKTPLYSKEFLKAVAEIWNVKLKKLHRNIPIQGSPERSLFRVVLEDRNGGFFVLEQVPKQSLERKKQIATILETLAKAKMARFQPYLADKKGNRVIKYKKDFWQISSFVKGEELNREKYIYEKWRGTVLAAFLIELSRKSQKLDFGDSCSVFSLKNYVYKLVREINLYNKDIMDEINSVVNFLEKDFMPKYEKLPVAFCHGDYHPLNIIWSVYDIKCVIDWEFCGFKSELYDAANLIGCVGVEDPQSLTGDLVKSFIADLTKAKIISKKSWKYLVEFIVALRFAWLAEWLRRKDKEMIRLELDYMRLMIDNKNILQKAWL
jgi:homoserine kinase type II